MARTNLNSMTGTPMYMSPEGIPLSSQLTQSLLVPTRADTGHSMYGHSVAAFWKWQRVDDHGPISTTSGLYVPFDLTNPRSCTTSRRLIFQLCRHQSKCLISVKTFSYVVSSEIPLSVRRQRNSWKIPGLKASKKLSTMPRIKKHTPQVQNTARIN